MQKLHLGVVALALAEVLLFGFFCLTVTHFEGGDLKFNFQTMGGIKLDAEVNKVQAEHCCKQGQSKLGSASER